MTLIDISDDLSDLTDEETAWVKNKWGGSAEDAGAESGASRSLLRSTIKYPPPKLDAKLGEARDDERSIDIAFKRGGAGTTLKESPQARRYNTTTKDAKKGSFWSYQAVSRTPNFYELPKGLWSGTREEWEGLSPGMRREIVRQAERRGENKDGARDLAPGQISSSETSRFRAMPARQQAEVIKLAELVKRYRFSDPEKASQYQKQLDRLAGDAEWEESKHPRDEGGKFGSGGGGGSADKASKAIEALNDKFPVDPDNDKERMLVVGGKKVGSFEVIERDGRLRIKGIDAIEPGSGVGSLLLRRILKAADREGAPVELTASSKGHQALSTTELKAWYGRHGFVEEPGFDPALGYMIRKPKSAEAGDAFVETQHPREQHGKFTAGAAQRAVAKPLQAAKTATQAIAKPFKATAQSVARTNQWVKSPEARKAVEHVLHKHSVSHRAQAAVVMAIGHVLGHSAGLHGGVDPHIEDFVHNAVHDFASAIKFPATVAVGILMDSVKGLINRRLGLGGDAAEVPLDDVTESLKAVLEQLKQYQKQLNDNHAKDEWEESKHPRGQPGNAGQFGPGGAGGGEAKGGREVKPEPYLHNYASAEFGNKEQKESAERNRQRAEPEAPAAPKAGSLKSFESVKDPSTLSPEEIKQRVAHADAYSKELAKHPTNEIDTPERHALRKRLTDEIYNKDAGSRKHERDATIILGLPASGKSTIANPVISEKGAIEIDPDIAKAMLPEYENGLGAAAVHEESSDITKDVLKRAMSNGDNFVWPRVDSPQKVVDDVMMLKKLGYKVHLKHLIVDPNEAVRSATSRFLKTGRYVPLELITEFGTKPRETYEKAKHLADSAEEVERKAR